MRILVTGGAGFIGSTFVKHMLRTRSRDEVLVIDALTYAGNPENLDECRDDPRFSFWYGNVTNGELVQDLVETCDVVFHFAAESHVARSLYDNSAFFVTDVLGTQSVANAVVKSKRTRLLVHISTSEVYGTAQVEPMDESHPLNPLSPYAGAKAGADRLVYSYRAAYGIPAVIVRPFNNYGPYQHLEKVVPRFITSALDGRPMTVHGDGSAMRDWLHVDDTVAALALFLDYEPTDGPCEVFNLGTGRATSVLEIARMILAITGRSPDTVQHIGDRPGQVSKHLADASRFSSRFSWRPQVGLEDGLERSVHWYRSHVDWWRKLEWMRHVPVRLATGEVEYH